MTAAASLPAGSRVLNSGARLALWIERNEAVSAAAILGAVVLRAAADLRRPMWFDELFTYFISRLNSVHEMLAAIPADGNPPLYYLFAHFFLWMGLPDEAAVRMPSLIGFSVALVSIYVFLRRRFGVVAGLIGMLLAATSAMASYAAEARPYGLMLGFTGLALVSWQAAQGRGKGWALAGIAFGFAGAIGSHHYGIFHVGMPLLFGEAWRLYERRRPDWRVWIASAAGLSMLAVSIPFARATHLVMLDSVKQSVNFWSRPEAWHLFDYFRMVSWWALGVVAAALWVSRRGAGPVKRRTAMPPSEIAAAAGLALLLELVLVVTAVATGYFQPRYAIGGTIGVAVLVVVWMYTCGGRRDRLNAAGALCVVTLAVLGFVPFEAREYRTVNGRIVTAAMDRNGAAPLDLESVRGEEPIVVESALGYTPMWWYSSQELRGRLRYLADLRYAVKQPDFLPELSLVANQACVPAKADGYAEFIAAHRRFLIYSFDAARLEWTAARLKAAGWKISTVYRGKTDELFEAEAPGGSRAD